MELYIHKYLTKFYDVGISEECGKKIQLLVTHGIYYRDDVSEIKELAYGKSLLKEISTVFGITKEDAKSTITLWAQTIIANVDLTWYWKQEKLADLMFPAAVRIAAQTIGMDLVSVQPMNGPTGTLIYFDTPNENGRIYNEEAFDNMRRDYMATENDTAQNWENLRHEAIQELLENQKQVIGVSSRRKED